MYVRANNHHTPGHRLETQRLNHHVVLICIVFTHLPQFHVPDHSTCDLLENEPGRTVYLRRRVLQRIPPLVNPGKHTTASD
jgi:hypothetical protein